MKYMRPLDKHAFGRAFIKFMPLLQGLQLNILETPEKAIRCLNANSAIERRESRSHACLYRDQ
jgi:hypothetical protein